MQRMHSAFGPIANPKGSARLPRTALIRHPPGHYGAVNHQVQPWAAIASLSWRKHKPLDSLLSSPHCVELASHLLGRVVECWGWGQCAMYHQHQRSAVLIRCADAVSDRLDCSHAIPGVRILQPCPLFCFSETPQMMVGTRHAGKDETKELRLSSRASNRIPCHRDGLPCKRAVNCGCQSEACPNAV